MDEQPVDRLERHLRQVLVRPVDRVPRLEADHAPPAALGEDAPRLRGIPGERGVRRLRALEDRDAAAQVVRLLLVEPRDARMRIVLRAEALRRLALRVVREHLADLKRREQCPVLVREHDRVAARRTVDRQTDGQGPREPDARCISSTTPS